MRIAVMLRAYDKPGGIGIYSRNIIKHLLEIDKENHYILIYNSQDHLGTYSGRGNVEEICIPAASALIWDQVLVPRRLKKYAPDLIFHTKFTVPIAAPYKKIMALHGASWFVHPELYGKFDVLYVRTVMPIYCRKADYLISNSELTTQDHIRILKVPENKIRTILLAAGEEFRPITNKNRLDQIRASYNLPDRFLLTVTSYDPRKNFGTLIDAFDHCRKHVDCHLVVVGKNCNRYSRDHDLKGRNLDRHVTFCGWVEQEDLPAFYSLAEAFVFPSVYEEFGIPIVEAMSCGCPVISSDTGAIPELTGDCALLSAPFDYMAFGENITTVLTDTAKAEQLRNGGLKRAGNFSWHKTASKTLDIFKKVTAEEKMR